MDLIDEEHFAFAQIREDGRQVPLPFQGRAARDPDIDIQFIGNDIGKGRLAEAGRSVEQDMVKSVTAFQCSLDEDFHIVLDFFLSDVFLQAPRPQAVLPAVLQLFAACDDTLFFVH